MNHVYSVGTKILQPHEASELRSMELSERSALT